MKSKRIVSLAIMGVLAIGGTTAYANAANAKSTPAVKMQLGATKLGQTGSSQVKLLSSKPAESIKGEVTQEQASSILQDGLKEYFNQGEPDKNLYKSINAACNSKGEVEEWVVYWKNEKTDKKTHLKETSIVYGGSVNAKTGEITHLIAFGGNANKQVQNISAKELKDIGINFMEKHNLVDNAKDFKLLGEYLPGKLDSNKRLVFSSGDKVMYITVDLTSKSVIEFSGGTLDLDNTKAIS